MQAKKNPTQQQFPLQVVKHCVLGVLNFKGQALKTHVLGSKPKIILVQSPRRYTCAVCHLLQLLMPYGAMLCL